MGLFRSFRNWFLTIGMSHIDLHVGKSKPKKGWVWVQTPVEAIYYLERYEVSKMHLEYDLGEAQGTGLGLAAWLCQHPEHTPLIVHLKGTQEQMSKMSLGIQQAKAIRYGSSTRYTYKKYSF